MKLIKKQLRSRSPVEAEKGLISFAQTNGLKIETVRTFAAISSPQNRHLFTVNAAMKAFSGTKS